jgi:hypothetical protein
MMKQIKPKINLEKLQLQLICEADEEALRGGRTTTGRDIIIHTSSGDDIVSG